MENIRQLFNQEREKYVKEAVKSARKQSGKVALITMIHQYQDFLERRVVAGSCGAYVFMRYLGQFGPDELFYNGIELYVGGGKKDNNVPLVSAVEHNYKLPDNAILDVLQKKESEGVANNELVLPAGFFFFEFRAQWAAGGYDEPETWKEVLIYAKDFPEAADFLARRLSGMRENCFDHFRVYFDGHWRPLHTKQGNRRGGTVHFPGFGAVDISLD